MFLLVSFDSLLKRYSFYKNNKMPEYSQYNVPGPEEIVNFGVGQPSTRELPLDSNQILPHSAPLTLLGKSFNVDPSTLP